MRRRSLLLGIGATTTYGFAGLARRRPPERLEGRIWLTADAMAHAAAATRAVGYVEAAMADVGVAVDLSVADEPVTVPTADDRRVRRVVWPRLVLAGAVGRGGVEPVRDVNLLLTDGDVGGKAAGYGMARVAAVAGARHLAAAPPADETSPVVDYSVPGAVAQLLLHEWGHALGLDHDHGRIEVDDAAVTASPMVSGYAWAPAEVRARQFDAEANACGEPTPDVTDGRRRLSMRYAPCAAAAIRRYRPGPVV